MGSRSLSHDAACYAIFHYLDLTFFIFHLKPLTVLATTHALVLRFLDHPSIISNMKYFSARRESDWGGGTTMYHELRYGVVSPFVPT